MKKNTSSMSRRSFFNSLMKNFIQVGFEVKDKYEEGKIISDVFSSFETRYPLTLHYPRVFFEESAKRLDIDIDAVGIDRAVELIMMHDETGSPSGRRNRQRPP